MDCNPYVHLSYACTTTALYGPVRILMKEITIPIDQRRKYHRAYRIYWGFPEIVCD